MLSPTDHAEMVRTAHNRTIELGCRKLLCESTRLGLEDIEQLCDPRGNYKGGIRQGYANNRQAAAMLLAWVRSDSECPYASLRAACEHTGLNYDAIMDRYAASLKTLTAIAEGDDHEQGSVRRLPTGRRTRGRRDNGDRPLLEANQ